jgi:uncharacterized OB-fold protein
VKHYIADELIERMPSTPADEARIRRQYKVCRCGRRIAPEREFCLECEERGEK